MNRTVDTERFCRTLASFDPDNDRLSRTLALYSAAVAVAEEPVLTAALEMARRLDIDGRPLYECTLQSYLFLGFPRMLIAAEQLAKYLPGEGPSPRLEKMSPDESERWFHDGVRLCRRVYGDKYESLKARVEGYAPDIFRWMIVEGYGKVLSRDEVTIVDRELSIIAMLMMENKIRQLHSHILGARNVGADERLIKQVIDDVGIAAGDGYAAALAIVARERTDR
jgi:alkylhydroperoxidase/carboxymuconolactone decarboxylase family protein YurZ